MIILLFVGHSEIGRIVLKRILAKKFCDDVKWINDNLVQLCGKGQAL
jgi:hypothetical protein